MIQLLVVVNKCMQRGYNGLNKVAIKYMQLI